MSTGFSPITSAAPLTVEYSQPAGIPLYLDAVIPPGPGPFPSVIVVHGGGWVRGDRRTDVEPLLKPVTSAGIAWFSIDYRLCKNMMEFGIAIEDVRKAIRYVRARASDYRIDPDRIALIGESAGGQLAAMAALDKSAGTDVRAVVALYTPMDLVTLAKDSTLIPPQIFSSLKGTPFEKLILARLGDLSPIGKVHAGAPPFLLIHGNADRLVPFSQSIAMRDRLMAAGVDCEMYTVNGGGHGIRWWESSHPAEAAKYKVEMVRWLKARLEAPSRADMGTY